MAMYLVLRKSARRKATDFVAHSPAREEIVAEVVDLSTRDLSDLRRDSDVIQVAPSMPTQLIRPLESASSPEWAIPEVSWGVEAVGAAGSEHTGAGVTVAVLDTGIDEKHPAFAGLEIVSKNFTDDPDEDLNGHGTHCAGIICGRTTSGCRIGVAPGIKRALIGKVIGERGGTTTSLAKALLWAYELGSQVINMSVKIDVNEHLYRLAEEYPLDLALSRALTDYRANMSLFDRLSQIITEPHGSGPGVVVVAAAGDESRRDVHPSFLVPPTAPASSERFISVAALGMSPRGSASPFVISKFTNTWARLSAPGEGIVSAKLGGGWQP
jgi:subtilisin family serine protease